jgi:hypothetical protein
MYPVLGPEMVRARVEELRREAGPELAPGSVEGRTEAAAGGPRSAPASSRSAFGCSVSQRRSSGLG